MRVETTVPVRTESDIVVARRKGREAATPLNFSSTELALITTAISELARNIVRYAGSGEILLRASVNGDRPGITVIARDQGPGIANVAHAMRDGFSTSGSLGLGLPGVRRLMDEMEVVSVLGEGTTITVTKWAR